MDIKNTAIGVKVVIESLICLLENENVDISSIKFKVGSDSEGYESPEIEFQKLIDNALNELEELKTQVPEGFVLMPKKPDVDKAWSIALKRIVPPPKTNDAIQKELMYKKYVDDLYSEQDRILLDYEAMIEAQEQGHA